MKTIISLLISVLASSSFAASVPASLFTCKSAKTGLTVQTIPQDRTVQVYNSQGTLVANFPDAVPSYAYSDTLTPMFIDVKMVDGVSGKTILFMSEQAGKIIGAFKGDYSYICKKN